MKHPNDFIELSPAAVVDAAHSAAVSVTPAQAHLLVRHAALVLEANQQMNLTRITDPNEVLALHIVDSLAFLPYIEALEGRVVDIGSGAGYPGIPLAILGSDVTLCESVKKKAAFLEGVIVALGLEALVQPVRAEELAAQAPLSADVVVARAVSSAAALVELASPLLRTGGRLIVLKGSPPEDELARVARAASMCGMVASFSAEYRLPTGQQRMVLVFEKVGKSHLQLPRRPGAAQRQPLG